MLARIFRRAKPGDAHLDEASQAAAASPTAPGAGAGAGASSPAPDTDLSSLTARLAADLRECIRAIMLFPPLQPAWLVVVRQVSKVAAIVEAERRIVALAAAAAGPLSAAAKAASATSGAAALWEGDEFCLRYLLEDGKLNLLLRLGFDYLTFLAARPRMGVAPRLSARSSMRVAMRPASSSSNLSAALAAAAATAPFAAGSEPAAPFEAMAAAHRFEHALGVVLATAWAHCEAVQTSDLPLACSLLALALECSRRCSSGSTSGGGGGAASPPHSLSAVAGMPPSPPTHTRPQLVGLCLRVATSLCGPTALAAVGDDRMALTLLRIEPALSVFALLPGVLVSAMEECDGADLEGDDDGGRAPDGGAASEGGGGGDGGASPLPGPVPTAGGDLLVLECACAVADVMAAEDFLTQRPRLLAGADAALAAAAGVYGGGEHAADSQAGAFAASCARLRPMLLGPRLAGRGGTVSPELRLRLRPLLDLCDAVARRAAVA